MYLTKDCEIICLPKQQDVACIQKKQFRTLPENSKRISLDLKNKNIRFVGYGPLISDHLWERIIYSKEVQIFQNDVLRVGKIVLIVQSIHLDTEKNHNIGEKNIQKISIIKSPLAKEYYRIKNPENFTCRICFGKEENSDPFLELCTCMKTNPVHLSCMKQWLSTKTNISKNEDFEQYDLKEVKCEICAESYPLSIKYKEREEFLFCTNFDEK